MSSNHEKEMIEQMDNIVEIIEERSTTKKELARDDNSINSDKSVS